MNSEEKLQLLLGILEELKYVLIPTTVIDRLNTLKETLQRDVEFEKHMEEVFGISSEYIKD